MQPLIDKANAARSNAHAPYSTFYVGACILTKKGDIFSGCNVENAAYPLGQCAECTAIGNMVVVTGKQVIDTIVITSSSPKPCPPCGGCRQVISEFSDKDTVIHMVSDNGETLTKSVGELLPFSFDEQSMECEA